MRARTSIGQALAAVVLAIGCESEIVTEEGTSATAASSVASSTSASTGTGGMGGTSGTGGAPQASCRDDSDCLRDEACRYTTSDGCADPLPHCVPKMSADSDCEHNQKWDDPSSNAWACTCLGDSPGLGIVYLECGTQAYPEPVSPAGRPCGPR